MVRSTWLAVFISLVGCVRPPPEKPRALPAPRSMPVLLVGFDPGAAVVASFSNSDDRELAALIRSRLGMVDVGLPPAVMASLVVRVAGGVATLRGMVDTLEQKRLIGDEVARTSVRLRVINLLMVREQLMVIGQR